MSESKEWTEDEIRANLEKYDKWVERAVVAIYNLQTEYEKQAKGTNRYNGVGFNKFDAGFLTDLAESYKQYGGLTEAQIDAARDSIKKYAGQLAAIANDNLDEYRS
jgi:hypothetical protein